LRRVVFLGILGALEEIAEPVACPVEPWRFHMTYRTSSIFWICVFCKYKFLTKQLMIPKHSNFEVPIQSSFNRYEFLFLLKRWEDTPLFYDCYFGSLKNKVKDDG
jgi:hypothetical protein